MKSPFNILITGVGGQGVVTLASVFRKICDMNNLHSTGSVIKGGAQRLGTIYATLRIFDEACADYRDHSLDIPDGRLDLLIGLEPWEGLRAHRLCGNQTNVLLNRAAVPLLVARTKPIHIEDPVAEFEKLGSTLQCQDYTTRAIDKHGDKKMLNFEMGRDAIRMCIPAFTVEQFDRYFREQIVSGQTA